MSNSLRSVPAAPGRLPLLGHVIPLLHRPLPFLESLRTVGEIARVDIGIRPMYFLTTPELVHDVLVTQAHSFERGKFFDGLRLLLGNGLATSDGDFHRKQRRLMQPFFNREKMGEYLETMRHHSARVAESWRPGQTIEVDQEMYQIALTTVMDAMFSSDLGRAAVAEVQRSLPVVMKGVLVRTVLPKSLDRLTVNRRFDDAAARLRQVVDQVIDDYHAKGIELPDLLTRLMSARDAETGAAMTDLQLRDELVTIMGAGMETTSTTLAWLFHELARHPDAEQRLHDEIDAVVGDRPVTFEDIPHLEYTSRVIKEVTRLYSLPVFTRKAVTGATVGGVRFPVGTEIAYSLHALHRDPRTFTDPERFDPDRWLPERTGGRLFRNEFIPFGAGSHKCIGEFFAEAQMAIAVATIATRWRLRPDPGHRVRVVVAVFPHPDRLPMSATPRGR